jgi:hypothetical protein
MGKLRVGFKQISSSIIKILRFKRIKVVTGQSAFRKSKGHRFYAEISASGKLELLKHLKEMQIIIAQ